MFLQLSVILFTRGVCLSACWDTPLPKQTPPEQTPQSRQPPGADTHPGAGTPPGSRHPPVQCMLGDTANKRAVRILLECNLVQYCCLNTVINHLKWFRQLRITLDVNLQGRAEIQFLISSVLAQCTLPYASMRTPPPPPHNLHTSVSTTCKKKLPDSNHKVCMHLSIGTTITS